MRQRTTEDAGAVDAGLGRATLAALARCAETRARRWLLVVTVLLGLLAAVAIGAGVPPADRTFTILAEPVQALMSFTLPFLGVLLAADVLRSPRPAPLAPTLLAAILLAAAVGLLGALLCAVSLALFSADGSPGTWSHAGMIVAGGVLVQAVANLSGTGFGLLLRPALAIPATVVPPLGLYFLLGAVLPPAQGWLTPYAALQDLLSGEMTAFDWAQWFVVASIWAVGLNVAGWLRLKRRSAPVGDHHPAVGQ